MNLYLMQLAEGWRGSGWHGGDGGWWWLAWPIGWVVILAVIGLGVWLLVRATGQNRPGGVAYTASPTEGARRILADRFARGEIDEEEYRNRLAALS